MTTSQVLDIAGLAVGALFVTTTVVAQVVAGRGRTTLRRLVVAYRWQLGAAATAVANVAVHAANVPDGGPIRPLLWVANVGLSAVTAVVLRRRRDLRGDEVLADAERIVHAYRPDFGRSPTDNI